MLWKRARKVGGTPEAKRRPGNTQAALLLGTMPARRLASRVVGARAACWQERYSLRPVWFRLLVHEKELDSLGHQSPDTLQQYITRTVINITRSSRE
jgi:hypothetical protein